MSNSICVINEQEVLGKQFRVYGSVDEPLFLAKDVATWIEHSDVSMMLSSIDSEEKLIQTILVSGQNRECWFLTEDGLYEVLMLSRKPIAKQFKSKVKEILRTLRKTGSYSITKSPMERILENSKNQYEAALAIADMLKIEQDKQRLIESRADKAEDEVKTLVHDDENTYTATDIAKDLGFRSAIAFNQWLKDIGFQYKQGKHWVVKAKYAEEGLVNIKLKDTGNGFNVKTMQFTNKGKLWITNKFKETHPKVLEIEYM